MARPAPLAYVLVSAVIVYALMYLSRSHGQGASRRELTAERRFKTWAELDMRRWEDGLRDTQKLNDKNDDQKRSARHPINPFPLRRKDKLHLQKGPLDGTQYVPDEEAVVIQYVDENGDLVGKEPGLSVDYEQDGRNAQNRLSD